MMPRGPALRLAVLAGCLAVLFVLHRETFLSMAEGWQSSTTYTHGFLILPLALFFAWRRRAGARAIPTRTYWPGAALVLLLSMVWLLARLVHTQVLGQLASIGLIGATVLALTGPAMARRFAFPLSYLFFCVPFGEGLIPTLMEFTADFTVAALDVVGVPVIRDGLYFSTANGSFEIAKACSGVRYLLASTALGVAFAFLTYTSYVKRLVFIASAVLVPIVANGFRAFGIVLIAHYSEMKYAIGVDHFIYGWVFFGFIMFVLFWCGSHFADPHPPAAADAAGVTAGGRHVEAKRQVLFTGAVVAMSVGAGAWLLASAAGKSAANGAIAWPVADGAFEGPYVAEPSWPSGYRGAERYATVSYTSPGGRIELTVVRYLSQEQGGELVNSQNRLARGDWSVTRERSVSLPDAVPSAALSVVVHRGDDAHLVLYWYQVGDRTATGGVRAKLLEARGLLRDAPTSMLVTVAAEGVDAAASARLRAFLERYGERLVECLADSAEAGCAAARAAP